MQIQNIAMPAKKTAPGFQKRGSKYNFAALGVNDGSCIVLDDVLDPRKAQTRLSSALANHRKSGGVGKFAVRTFDQVVDGQTRTLVGVWRTE